MGSQIIPTTYSKKSNEGKKQSSLKITGILNKLYSQNTDSYGSTSEFVVGFCDAYFKTFVFEFRNADLLKIANSANLKFE